MPPPSPAFPRVTPRERLVLCLVLGWFWLSAWTASKDLPAVADEIGNITGGESFWRYGAEHLQPENSYFAMHWSTLPWRWHPPVFPAMPPDLPQGTAMVVMGNRFFYESGNDPAALLSVGRAMMAFVGVALVALIGWWGRRLWGPRGGLLALLLASFSPTLLAQSGLVMSDVTLSFFLLLTVTLWWQLLNEVSLGGAVVCGLSLGAAQLSKMSGVLAAPIFLILLAVRLLEPGALAWRWAGPRQATGVRKWVLLGGAAIAVAGVAVFVLWAAYGFQFSMYAHPAAPSPRMEVTWDNLLHTDGLLLRLVGGLRHAKLLPEEWLLQLAHTHDILAGRLAFLNGHTYTGGTLAYFPYAWLVKTPLALFGLMALGLAVACGRRPSGPGAAPDMAGAPAWRRWRDATPLVVLFVVYWIFALTSSINIGQRHLLPIYAPMLILAGGAAGLLGAASRATRLIVAVLVIWFVAESLWVRPHYLSYFNAIAGGPANGYRHLVDSNVDVGQDLIALRQWLDADTAARGSAEPVFLSYFGPADPVAHGIHATRFGDNGFDAHPRGVPAAVGGGLYCISVTLFQGLYTFTPGPWTTDRETYYRQLLAISATRRLTRWEALDVEYLRFARLRNILAARKPDARVGNTILIFRLREDEVALALFAPLPELQRRGLLKIRP